MKDVRITIQAGADLRDIRSYFAQFKSDKLVLDDIYDAISMLRSFPMSGRAIAGKPYRRKLTRRYRFNIAYLIEPETIVVLGVFRYQDRDR